MDLVCQHVREQLSEIQGAARRRGLVAFVNVYVSPARPRPRETLALLVKVPGGGRRKTVCWWPSWGRCSAGGKLQECKDWRRALELAVGMLNPAGNPLSCRPTACQRGTNHQ
jgi:hypothetical protein